MFASFLFETLGKNIGEENLFQFESATEQFNCTSISILKADDDMLEKIVSIAEELKAQVLYDGFIETANTQRHSIELRILPASTLATLRL